MSSFKGVQDNRASCLLFSMGFVFLCYSNGLSMVISLSKLRLDPPHTASCYRRTAAQVALVYGYLHCIPYFGEPCRLWSSQR